TTLSTASSTFLTLASVLEPIIPAAQPQLNTTTHNDGWINSTHVEPQEEQTGPNSLILGLNSFLPYKPGPRHCGTPNLVGRA
ncbi:hypothetical protein CROQUDRAFT_661253, partial [Cronartium quercuum f. sp. fusiforme G11]